MRIPLHKFAVQKLDSDGETDICIPIQPSTCTVLGCNVTARSIKWVGLDFTRSCWIDGSTFGELGVWEYLHVSFRHPNDTDRDDWVVYRVRCRLEIGDAVQTKYGKTLVVAAVRVAGIIDGKWNWRVGLNVEGGRTRGGSE